MTETISQHAVSSKDVDQLQRLKTVFVHSDLDDAGLTAPAFRVLCHLSRRAGTNGLIFSGLEDMAEVCRLEKKTVRAALRTLEQRNMITTFYRPGMTAHRRINPLAKWRRDPSQTATPPKRHPCPIDGSTPHPNGTPTPLPNGCHEGNPLKEIQEKEIPTSAFVRFWNQYPKKIKRTEAGKIFASMKLDEQIDRILSALQWQRRSSEWLRDGGQYVPFPTNYLRGRRWEDEPGAQQAQERMGMAPAEAKR